MTRLLILLVTLACFAGSANASFTPHADCSFNKIEPLPEVEDCDALDRRIKRIRSNMASAQRAIDALRGEHGDAIDDLLLQAGTTLGGAATGFPTSAADCVDKVLEYCGSRFAGAIGAISSIWDASNTFADGMNAVVAWRRWRAQLQSLKAELQEAEAELAECLERRETQAKEHDDAAEYNRKGVPKYPADHPLCKPPEDEKPVPEENKDEPLDGGGATGAGGTSNGHEVDRSAGGSDSSNGTGGHGGVTLPDWSRVTQFNRVEINNALNWMDAELSTCANFERADRRSCANATMGHHNKLRGNINKKINAAPTAAERTELIQERNRLLELNERRGELRR